MDKSQLRTAIVKQLEADLALLTEAALTSRDEATHEESRAENQYDMHAQEAAYLAEGQAKMAAELRETLAHYQTLELSEAPTGAPIAVGAVVTVEPNGGEQRTYFVGPRAGGLEVDWEKRTVMVVTPASPLGRQLMGRLPGDKIQLPSRTGTSDLRILSVD